MDMEEDELEEEGAVGDVKYLIFWEEFPDDRCTYDFPAQYQFDATKIELEKETWMLVHKGGLRQCRVDVVHDAATAKLRWVRPPTGEPKEFDFDFIEPAANIDEWSIRGYHVDPALE